jgi:hypothetical protein
VGYRFSLVLSREITDEESAVLREAGCAAAIFGTDSLPTNADVTVTKMDFDDTVTPTLAEAIEAALEAVKSVPDLSVPGLTVPAQPAGPVTEDQKVVAGEVITDTEVTEEQPAAETEAEPAAKKAPARKPGARKTSPRKTPAKKGSTASNGHRTENGSPDDAAELVKASADAE